MQPENSLENSSFHQFMAMQSLCLSSSSSFYPTGGGMDHQLLDFNEKSHEARAFAASENHKEAERKRRERINSHLDSLRNLLLCSSKTDKASLLAKVVQRVRELKHRTSEIMQCDQTFPSETDEVAVVLLQNDEDQCNFNGKSVVKASLCCEDRIDLIPDLIEILKPLPLRPLRAEMATLGGRIRNVIVLAGEKNQTDESVLLMLKDSLKTLILRSNNYGAGDRSKRRRMFDQSIMR